MNINDLKNFLYVCENPSISHTAKLLGLSQPTLTESIKRLERDTGVELFYRSKKGVTLTAAGKEARLKAQAILTLSDELTREGGLKGSYRLGAHAIVAEYFMSSFIQKTDVDIHLEHGRSQDIQTLVQDGVLDFAVVVNPRRNPDLIIKKLCDDRMTLWQHSKKIPEERIICDPELLQSQTLIRSHAKLSNKILATESFGLIAELIEKGLGVGILPSRYVQMKKLKFKEMSGAKAFKDEICLLYRPEFGKSDVEKQMITTIVESFA